MTGDERIAILQVLTEWAKNATAELNLRGCYLFGSLIYKDGVQFGETSDVDLVLIVPHLNSAIERWRWLKDLAQHKDTLEGKLLRLLHRRADEPIASIVPITEMELLLDIHKDGHREFYRSNIFYNLNDGSIHDGLASAGSQTGSRFVLGALAGVQKLRNEYLATSANGTATLRPYAGADPIPKRLMRAAAMASKERNAALGPGAEYDVQEGLDLLSSELYDARDADHAFRALQDIVSVRRNARGNARSLSADELCLLNELVFGLVTHPTTAANTLAGGTSLPSDNAAVPVVVLADNNPIDESTTASSTAETARDQRSDTLILDIEPGGYMFNSLVFFSQRFASAFPGVREIRWFEDQVQIETRLTRLLRAPLQSPEGRTPIWYWRGGNYHIERFERLKNRTYLMNFEELDIRRIAAVPGRNYQWSFVYVETNAMAPTGLYTSTEEDLNRRIERWGYDNEEYGLFRGEIPISRGEYDDGAAELDGEIVDTAGQAELRVRYTTPYNFLIAAHGSPINNSEFDGQLTMLMNRSLREDAITVVPEISEIVDALPLRHFE